MKVYQAVAKAVAAQGVEQVFGLMGQANMHMIHSLVSDHGVQYVKAATENGAVLMAYGFAARSGKLGVACVTRGPGLTNTVTALTEAARRRLPMLVLVGDTATGNPWSRQDIDQRKVVEATGAHFQRVHSAESVSADIVTAISRAILDRRPSVISVRLDVMVADVASFSYEAIERATPAVDLEAVDAAVGVIASASRPVILAGRGAVHSGARSALLELAQRLGAPVATTLGAKDLFAGDALNLGICGSVASAGTGQILSQADCLIVFGAGLNYDTTAKDAFVKGKRVVQVDDALERIGQRVPVAAGVVGDAREVATKFSEWLDQLDSAPKKTWFTQDAATERVTASALDSEQALTTATLTARLNEILPRDRTVVCDVGGFMIGPMTLLSVADPAAMVLATSFGSIGLALSTGIGAAFSRPRGPVVVAVGDGGIMESFIELWTAKRYSLDLIVVIYNNRSYDAEVRVAEDGGFDVELVLSDWPDFVPLSEALGATAVSVTKLSDLDDVARAIERGIRPLVVDVALPRHTSAV